MVKVNKTESEHPKSPCNRHCCLDEKRDQLQRPLPQNYMRHPQLLDPLRLAHHHFLLKCQREYYPR